MYHVGSDVLGQLETDTPFCHYHSIKPSPVCLIILYYSKLCTGIDFHFTVYCFRVASWHDYGQLWSDWCDIKKKLSLKLKLDLNWRLFKKNYYVDTLKTSTNVQI